MENIKTLEEPRKPEKEEKKKMEEQRNKEGGKRGRSSESESTLTRRASIRLAVVPVTKVG